MKSFFILGVIAAMWLGAAAQQSSSAAVREVKIEQFVVTKNTSFDDLSYLFHAEKSAIRSLNKKNQFKRMFFPGAVINMPVPTMPQVWNPFAQPETNNLPSLYDYDIDYDGLEPEVKSSFMAYHQIATDSFHYLTIENNIKKIDSKINALSNTINSQKSDDFGINGLNSERTDDVFALMQIAKNKYYSKTRYGREMDSLSKAKENLKRQLSKIKNRLNEYEYLIENHSYFVQQKGVDRKSYWEGTLVQKSEFKRQKIEKLSAEDVLAERKATRKSKQTPAADTKSTQAEKDVSQPTATAPKRQENMDTETRQPPQAVKNESEDSKSAATLPESNPLPQSSTIELTRNNTQVTPSDVAIRQPTTKVNAAVSMTMSEEEKEEVNAILTKYSKDTFMQSLNPSVVAVKTVNNTPTYMLPADPAKKMKADIYFSKARDYFEHNMLKEGERILVKSLEENPNNAEAWIMHADISLLSGNTENAAREYRIASEIDPNNAIPLYNIGHLYYMSNNMNTAMEYYNKSIDVNPGYYKAYIGRAKVFENSREYESALGQYAEAARIGEYPSVMKGQALALLQLRRFDEAEKQMTNYLKKNTGDGEMYYNYAMIYLYKNDNTKACTYFQTAADQNYPSAKNAIRQFCK